MNESIKNITRTHINYLIDYYTKYLWWKIKWKILFVAQMLCEKFIKYQRSVV